MDGPVSAWPADALPSYLRPRIEIVDDQKKVLGTGRDLEQLKQRLQKPKTDPALEPVEWQRAAQKWERFGLTGWSFGDLPDRITVSEGPDLPLYAWPGLEIEDGGVNLRLFRTAESARDASRAGVARLIEFAIHKDLAWIEKDLRALSRLAPLYAVLGPPEELQATALGSVKQYLLAGSAGVLPASEAEFHAAVELARARLPGIAQKLIDQAALILQLRQQIQNRLDGTAVTSQRAKTSANLAQHGPNPVIRASHPLASELAAILPPRFLESIPFDRLPHLPRYLKALQTRIDRAALNPVKDKERALQVAPYQKALTEMKTAARTKEAMQQWEEVRWMIEEYKVSLFAQELGTAMPISAKRLNMKLVELRGYGSEVPS